MPIICVAMAFTVTVMETEKLAAISGNAGIPPELQGCHTSFLGGYVIDGHVPIEAVQKLLAERPGNQRSCLGRYANRAHLACRAQSKSPSLFTQSIRKENRACI